MKRYFALFLTISLLAMPANISFAQGPFDPPTSTSGNKDSEKPATASDIQQAFERALAAVNSEKEKEEARTLAMLKEKLGAATGDWVSSEEKKREDNLNKLVAQNWETLIQFGDPAHYDYYLRDFKHIISGSDIVKTDSLLTPYKAAVNITEILYVEKYHTPDASDITMPMFFYTFTSAMKVKFEYRDNLFVSAGIEYGKARLDQGWPGEIRGLRNKYGERFRAPAL